MWTPGYLAEALFHTLEALFGTWEAAPSRAPNGAETWRVRVQFERVDDAVGEPPPTSDETGTE